LPWICVSPTFRLYTNGMPAAAIQTITENVDTAPIFLDAA
jgi:hypothetical protein